MKIKRFGVTSMSWVSKNMPIVINCAVGLVVLTTTSLIYTYAVIPHNEKKVREATIQELDINSQQRIPVLQLKAGMQLNKYVQITREDLANYFEVVQVPAQFAVTNPVSDTNSVVGKITTRNFQEHDQVSLADFVAKDDWFGQYDRLKEFDIYNSVAGTVASGNIVDVVVDYGDGSYDVVMAKKKINSIKFRGAVGADGTIGLDNNVTASSSMVFEVDETEYGNMKEAMKKGKLEVRIYLDETQKASPITFKNPNLRHTTPADDSMVEPSSDKDATAKTDETTDSAETDTTSPASGYQINTGN
ncbi:hypothetical protein ABGV42_00145 [Paenibacillus pabuli]|uniref:hypothetical protein n=1 Tax=Paenibacillus pabuli TaxID=1472 RepID=UPI003241E2A3